MSKGAISFFTALGLIFLIIGIIFRHLGLIALGIFTTTAAILVAFYFDIIRTEEVIENWSVLIKDGKEGAESIFFDTENFIKATEVPDIVIERRTLSPGVIKKILGVRRNFLVVREVGNPRLSPYQIFLNARNYGNNLHVSWYLTYRIGVLRAILTLLLFLRFTPKLLSDLDLFDQSDLIAYVTNIHHCTLSSVEKLMLSLKQDFSKVDRKTRGFLGVS